MAFLPDQHFSTFATGGTPTTGDIIVGLRGGINTQFNWVLPASITTITGTANQVLVDGTSGLPVSGAVTLTTPQDIAPTSSPTFAALTLTSPLTVANGGSGLATLSAFRLLAGGTTATGNLQQVIAGTAGQLLQSNGASALPTWTTATFPAGSGTLNHMLRSDGTNWVQTTATTLDASDVLSGLTQLNVDNLRLDGNTLSATDVNGNINLVPNGTGKICALQINGLAGSSSRFQLVKDGLSASSLIGSFINTSAGPNINFFKSRGVTVASFTAVQNNDDLGSHIYFGTDGTDGFEAASVYGRVDGVVSAGVVPGKLQWNTTNTSGVSTLGMTLNAAQNLILVNSLLVASGGSGRASSTAYALIAGGTTSTGIQQSLATGTAGQFLSSGGASALPAWTTATFPLVGGTAGTILRSNGTNFVNSTSTFADTYGASTLLYSNGANTVTGLATANNGILVTSSGGVPSIGNTVGAGLIMPSITFNTTSGVIGTTTNDDAAAGSVGELNSTIVLSASNVPLTSGATANVATKVLQPGDYDVWGELWTLPNALTTTASLIASIGTTSATIAGTPSENTSTSSFNVGLAAGVDEQLTIGACRIKVANATTATVYLCANAIFAVNTLGAYGKIMARRRR